MKAANIVYIFSIVTVLAVMASPMCHALSLKTILQEPCVSITVNNDEAYLLTGSSQIIKVSSDGSTQKLKPNLDLDRTEPEYSKAEDLAILNNYLIFTIGGSPELQICNLGRMDENSRKLSIPGLAKDDRPIRLQRCGDNLLVETFNGLKKLFRFSPEALVEIGQFEGILAGSANDKPLRVQVSGNPEKPSEWKVTSGKDTKSLFSIVSANKSENILDLRVVGYDKNHNLFCLLTQGPAEQNTSTWLIKAKSGKVISREKFFPVITQAMAKSEALSDSGILFAVRSNSESKDNGWGTVHIQKP